MTQGLGGTSCRTVTRARRSVPLVRVSLLALLNAGVAFAAVSPGSWKPERAVEVVVQNAPGGGADRIVRIMSNIMQERRLIEVPLNVVNKPGGGGSIAFNYLNQHAGDGHYVILAGKTLFTNNILGRGPSYSEFTPVAHLFSEYISVVVKPDSPIKSGKELIERLRKDPAALSFGVATTLGNPNHMGAAAPMKAAGLDPRRMRAVVFTSGGNATTAMLGGHIDAVPITAAFAASMLRQGQVRVLAVTAPTRLTGVLADVPTWRELGFDAVVSNWRAIVGPKGMTPAQVAYWDQTLRRTVESDDWKKELEANFWVNDYMGPAETRKLMDRENVDVRTLLVDVGLAK